MGKLLETAYIKYYDLMKKHVFGVLLNREDAEDVVQEAFLYVMHHERWWCAQKEDVREKYLFYALNYVCERLNRDKIRINNKSYEDTIFKENTSYMEEDNNLDRLYVRWLLRKLNRTEIKILSLRYNQGKTAKEIGKILGLSQSNVLQKLSRIKKKINRLCFKET